MIDQNYEESGENSTQDWVSAWIYFQIIFIKKICIYEDSLFKKR